MKQHWCVTEENMTSLMSMGRCGPKKGSWKMMAAKLMLMGTNSTELINPNSLAAAAAEAA